MTKPIKPTVAIPSEFATEGQKSDFSEAKLLSGFNPISQDTLDGDCLNKFIDDTYKGLNYSISGVEDLYRSLTTYDSTETYSKDAIVFYVDEYGKVALFISLTDNNTGHSLDDSTYWKEVSLGGNSRNIGEIVQSSLPLTDASLHLLDGALLAGNGIYAQFIDYIAELYADNPSANYFTDETSWQNQVTITGSCGKFVYDSTNNTVRLPKVSDILQGTTSINALGNLIEAGLPNMTTSTAGGHNHNRGDMNITGWFATSGTDPWSWTGDANGAFSKTNFKSAGNNHDQNIDNAGFGINLNAANSWTGNTSWNGDHSHTVNTGVGVSSTVQPQTIKVLVYIVVATSVKEDIQVDIDNIATDLNGKADRDLSNLSTTGQSILDNKANISLSNVDNNAKSLMAEMGMPSRRYAVLVLGNNASIYTAPANGYYSVTSNALTQAGKFYRMINRDSGYMRTSAYSTGNGDYLEIFLPVRKGDTVVVYHNGPSTNAFSFTYAQGSESEV